MNPIRLVLGKPDPVDGEQNAVAVSEVEAVVIRPGSVIESARRYGIYAVMKSGREYFLQFYTDPGEAEEKIQYWAEKINGERP